VKGIAPFCRRKLSPASRTNSTSSFVSSPSNLMVPSGVSIVLLMLMLNSPSSNFVSFFPTGF
jgi:hypothetical protein